MLPCLSCLCSLKKFFGLRFRSFSNLSLTLSRVFSNIILDVFSKQYKDMGTKMRVVPKIARPVRLCRRRGILNAIMDWIVKTERSVPFYIPSATNFCMPLRMSTPDLPNGSMFKIESRVVSSTLTTTVRIVRGNQWPLHRQMCLVQWWLVIFDDPRTQELANSRSL